MAETLAGAALVQPKHSSHNFTLHWWSLNYTAILSEYWHVYHANMTSDDAGVLVACSDSLASFIKHCTVNVY